MSVGASDPLGLGRNARDEGPQGNVFPATGLLVTRLVWQMLGGSRIAEDVGSPAQYVSQNALDSYGKASIYFMLERLVIVGPALLPRTGFAFVVAPAFFLVWRLARSRTSSASSWV